MKKKFKNESGVSLIELLVGVAVTALMMGHVCNLQCGKQ